MTTDDTAVDSVATPTFSVIIPVGGVDPQLDEQLVALAHQDVTEPWELVISLNTAEASHRTRLDQAVEHFVRLAGATAPIVTIVDSSDLRSASHARNRGAEAAQASLLLFCDGDDIADKSWTSTLVEALSDYGAVGGFLEEELLAVRGQENWRPPATPGGNPSFLGHPYLVSANMAVRADVFAAAGGFDTGLTRGEDIAFSWAMIRNGVELGFRDDAIVHYRHRRGLRPMLKQHYLYGRGMSEVLSRHGVPSADGSSSLLKANGQKVEKQSLVHILRRGSIAAGRLVGLVLERVRPASLTNDLMEENN